MADPNRRNLASFSAYGDENGAGQSDSPTDRPRYDDVHAQLMQEPTSESEAALLASGFPRQNATEATEAATPAENIAHIGDATLPPRGPAEPAGTPSGPSRIEKGRP